MPLAKRTVLSCFVSMMTTFLVENITIGGFQLQDINTEGTGPKMTMQFLVLHLLFQGVLLENISTETAMF